MIQAKKYNMKNKKTQSEEPKWYVDRLKKTRMDREDREDKIFDIREIVLIIGKFAIERDFAERIV